MIETWEELHEWCEGVTGMNASIKSGKPNLNGKCSKCDFYGGGINCIVATTTWLPSGDKWIPPNMDVKSFIKSIKAGIITQAQDRGE